MTDQEQTERGASTVTITDQGRAYVEWLSSPECEGSLSGAFAAGWQQCESHLRERVTAELVSAKQQNDQHLQIEEGYLTELHTALAEQDVMREVCEAAAEFEVGYWSDVTAEGVYRKRLFAALARLDATRKATADATEEGK